MGGELKVVVADDNVDAATTLAMLLQLLGCKTGVAYDGTTAIRLIRSMRPAMAILDIDMPGLDGCQEVQTLKSEPEHARRLTFAYQGATSWRHSADASMPALSSCTPSPSDSTWYRCS